MLSSESEGSGLKSMEGKFSHKSSNYLLSSYHIRNVSKLGDIVRSVQVCSIMLPYQVITHLSEPTLT